MDLNYLLSRHQLSLINADTTTNLEARHVHLGLAAGYAGRIQEHQRGIGAEAGLSSAL